MRYYRLYPNAERASILVTSLWVLTILLLLALGLGRQMGVDLRLVKHAVRRAEARALARGEMALRSAEFVAGASEIPADQGLAGWPWKPEPERYSRTEGPWSIETQVTDEQSRLNLNWLSQYHLSLLPHIDSPAEVYSVALWRGDQALQGDTDWQAALDEENRSFEELGLSYKVKGRPFQSFRELALIPTLDPERAGDWASLITVYGGTQVNLNTAPVEVLSLLLSQPDTLVDADSLARKIVDGREAWGLIEGVTELYEKGAGDFDLSVEEEIFLSNAEALLGVGSTQVRLSSVVSDDQGRIWAELVAVIDRRDGTTLMWEER
ncbi:MAG: general secretion pathway protein GspK [Candidatus Omnitrophica bacterium]|nr:general secretion pathway protein GspK [Candidatus Omnitrophota bacterium]